MLIGLTYGLKIHDFTAASTFIDMRKEKEVNKKTKAEILLYLTKHNSQVSR